MKLLNRSSKVGSIKVESFSNSSHRNADSLFSFVSRLSFSLGTNRDNPFEAIKPCSRVNSLNI